MEHLNRWRGPLFAWTFVGLFLMTFGTALRFHIGLLLTLLILLWLVWGAVLFIIALIGLINTRGRSWIVVLTVTLIFGVMSFGWAFLDAAGDRMVFEARRSSYEAAIAKLKAGEPAETACAEFRFGCGVSWKDGLRVAFYHPEFFDKYIGFVYDPSGVYESVHVLAEQDYEKYREEFQDELVPGIVLNCRPVIAPFYRCFFG